MRDAGRPIVVPQPDAIPERRRAPAFVVLVTALRLGARTAPDRRPAQLVAVEQVDQTASGGAGIDGR